MSTGKKVVGQFMCESNDRCFSTVVETAPGVYEVEFNNSGNVKRESYVNKGLDEHLESAKKWVNDIQLLTN